MYDIPLEHIDESKGLFVIVPSIEEELKGGNTQYRLDEEQITIFVHKEDLDKSQILKNFNSENDIQKSYALAQIKASLCIGPLMAAINELTKELSDYSEKDWFNSLSNKNLKENWDIEENDLDKLYYKAYEILSEKAGEGFFNSYSSEFKKYEDANFSGD